MSGLSGLWDQLVDAVCRPPRDSDYTDRDLVGGRKAAFRIGRERYYRQDLELENDRGEKLACSHYRPCIVPTPDGRLPAVVYCHCNSGSRRDAEEIVYHFLPRHVTVFALDCAGSGKSEGSWVTLGAREVEDVAAAVRYLRDEGAALTVGLWGRSMGSVAALLYAHRDPSIAGLVLDSPFSRLRDLMLELGASEASLGIPKALTRVALAVLKRSVRRRAGFSIDDVAPLDVVAQVHCPAFFGHGRGDTFVSPEHSRRLAAAYGGEARLELFEGDHNSLRPDEFYDEAAEFMLRALRIEELLGGCEAFWHAAAGATGAGARPGAGALSRRSAEPASPRRELNPPWSRSSVDQARGPGVEALSAEPESLTGEAWMTGWSRGRPLAGADSPQTEDEAEEARQLALALKLSLSERRSAGRAAAASGAPLSREPSGAEDLDEEAQQLAMAMELSLQSERAERAARSRGEAATESASPRASRDARQQPVHKAPVFSLDDEEEDEQAEPNIVRATAEPAKPAAAGPLAAARAQTSSAQHSRDEQAAVEKLAGLMHTLEM